ncbi:MAG: tRNA glutamyl-Q(34) synthetase GluQRS [Pseudomonadota bacterium]
MTSSFITRFAPSPTGLLHLGHAYSAILAHDAARAAGGHFVLRMEDIDATRCKPIFEEAIYEDLDWLGLSWDGPVWRQSERFDDYQSVIERWAKERLVYRCFKTRKEVAEAIARAPHDLESTVLHEKCDRQDRQHHRDHQYGNQSAGQDDGVGRTPPQAYYGTPLSPSEEAAAISGNEPFAWRLSLSACEAYLGQAFHALSFPAETGDKISNERARPQLFGDAIIGRKEGGVSYHLASVYDDWHQGITHVIRGQDLADAAHLHTLLQKLMGAPTPIYRHHKLINGADGKRLAKRNKAATLKALRDIGISPEEVRARVGLIR